jgi:hypothetical protein
MFVPPVQDRASALAIELGNKIAGLIQEFRQSHPGTSDADVRNAIRIAEMQSGSRARAQVAIAIGVALLLFGVLMAFFMSRGPGSGGPPNNMIILIIAGIAVAALAVKFVARR